MATCARCHGYLHEGHVCRRRPEAGSRIGDLFVGVVLGGALGVIVFGMIGDAVFGRALDTPGLVLGSIVGLTVVRKSHKLLLH
jgi:hypothetical protein